MLNYKRHIMEIGLKVFITLISCFIIYFIIVGTLKLWKSQIDVSATANNLVNSAVPDTILSIVVKRDDKKIYQNGQPVADVIGETTIGNGKIIFGMLVNSSQLVTGEIFEYRRYKLKFIYADQMIGSISIASDSGTKNFQNVIKYVVCNIIN